MALISVDSLLILALDLTTMVPFEVPSSVPSPSSINVDLGAVFTPPDTAALLVKGDLMP